MSYVAIAGAVVGAAGTAYSASQQSKAQKGAAGAINSKSAGTVPKAAEYEVVKPGKEQLHTIWDNMKAFNNGGAGLVGATNDFIDGDALKRVKRFVPGYKAAMAAYSQAGQDLLNGRLPYQDVTNIVSRQGELRNSLGTPGGAQNATLQDLGLSQLDAVKSGGGILKDMVSIAETVNPIGRRMTPQSLYLQPSDRVNWAIQQAQLKQQSDQNKNNLAAAADPAAAAQMQLQLGQAGQAAGGGGASSGYASAASQLISGIGSAYGGGSSGGAARGWSGNTSSYYGGKPAYYNGVVVPRAQPAYA